MTFGRESLRRLRHQLGRYVFAPQFGRACGGRAEPQPVEAAAGTADFALQVRRRGSARLGHLPVADDQVGRPAAIAQRGERRILQKRKRLLRTGRDAIVVGLLAVRTDAAIIQRADHLPIAFRPAMHALGAQLDAAAAVDARRGAANAELADLVAIPGRGPPNLARDVGIIRPGEGVVRGGSVAACLFSGRRHVGPRIAANRRSGGC